jgi:hypothetical protein
MADLKPETLNVHGDSTDTCKAWGRKTNAKKRIESTVTEARTQAASSTNARSAVSLHTRCQGFGSRVSGWGAIVQGSAMFGSGVYL